MDNTITMAPRMVSFFKVENNSFELTRIFKESFIDPKVSVRIKCKGGEERLMMALTPKRLFLYLCISISLLRPYTLFSRSPLVNKTLNGVIRFGFYNLSEKRTFDDLLQGEQRFWFFHRDSQSKI